MAVDLASTMIPCCGYTHYDQGESGTKHYRIPWHPPKCVMIYIALLGSTLLFVFRYGGSHRIGGNHQTLALKLNWYVQ